MLLNPTSCADLYRHRAAPHEKVLPTKKNARPRKQGHILGGVRSSILSPRHRPTDPASQKSAFLTRWYPTDRPAGHSARARGRRPTDPPRRRRGEIFCAIRRFCAFLSDYEASVCCTAHFHLCPLDTCACAILSDFATTFGEMSRRPTDRPTRSHPTDRPTRAPDGCLRGTDRPTGF